MRSLLLLLLGAIVSCTTASQYPFHIQFDQISSYIFSEGPMYSQADSPFGDGPSTVSVDGTATWTSDPAMGVPTVGVLNIVFVDESGTDAIGYERTADGEATTRSNLCCTQTLYDSGVCDEMGHLFFEDGAVGNATRQDVRSIELRASPRPFDASFNVEASGEQMVAFFYCPLNTHNTYVDVSGHLTFENPYGYLSGKSIGFLPFYAFMVSLYLVLLCCYLFLLVRYCNSLLWLQYCLFGLISMGFIEVCSWFFLYLQLNFTGSPVCCPLHKGAVVAVVMNVLKRTVSRCLLLAVCMGFGVVKPKLATSTAATILVLGTLFTAFAIYADIRINNDATPQDMDYWGLPVTLLDMIFVTWTYHSLTHVHGELKRRGQTVKVKMYAKLSNTLVAFVFLWVSFAVVTILIAKGIVPFSWKWQWTLHSFWHIAYFAILSVVSTVWAPSPSSHQYAYSFQIPASAEEAEEYECDVEVELEEDMASQEVEMTHTHPVAAAAPNGVAVAAGTGQNGDQAA